MPPTRSRAAGPALAASLVLVALGLPVAAASSPADAVSELFDAVEQGDFAAAEALVCEAERGAVRTTFDPAAQMGFDGDDIAAALSFNVADRAVEVVSEDGQAASVRVTGTMSLDAGGADVGELARSILEADMGADASDEDLERMLPFIEMAFSQELPIDEEVELIVENGEWVVCGGLLEPEEPDYGFEPVVSTEGLCGIVSPQDLNAVSELQYDSANGFENFCSYSNSDFDDYHGANVNLEFDEDVERMAQMYGADQALEVGGAAAFATGSDGLGTNLITQAGQDVLIVSVTLPEDPPAGLDWLTQATGVTEVFLPRVAEARLELVGPTPPPTPEPTPEMALCESLSLDALNELTGLGFDEVSGDSAYCGFASTDGEPGFHSLAVSLIETALDDYTAWLPEMEETSVSELRALEDASQLLIELPGGAYTLSVAGFLDSGDEETSLTDESLRRLVAETLLPTITVPEPTFSRDDQVDLGELEDLLSDPGSALTEGTASLLPKPMCEYLDLDAVNALGIVDFDSANSFWEEHCSLSRSDLSEGYAEVSAMVDVFTLDDVRGFFPDGVETTLLGLPAFDSGTDLRVETRAGVITFAAILSDAAAGNRVEPRDLLIAVAELVVPAIEADTAGE